MFSVLNCIIAVLIFGCSDDGLDSPTENFEFHPLLSSYQIFAGNPADLVPSANFHLYEISNQLFTDYAHKQRLIYVPLNTSMIAIDEDLPDFPNGTIFVKTFFYYNDNRDTGKGKKIIETRLLIKHDTKWNTSTYLWNDTQGDAVLLTTSLTKTINWIDENSKPRVIAYHIPGKRECATCHNASSSIVPIGPKMRNLNIDVVRNDQIVNQLNHLQNIDVLAPCDPASFTTVTKWTDVTVPLSDRARAYLDINCSHCHKHGGKAESTDLLLGFTELFQNTGIAEKKDDIKGSMEKGEMPLLGTTIIDEEGLALIKTYVENL
ncbi:MAG TPA: hypothetical protein VK666_06260 [Chryseolinea sp.]|nr:hypothetical protein [Chryseolinea sp.]